MYILQKTITLLEEGIKPIWVFDGASKYVKSNDSDLVTTMERMSLGSNEESKTLTHKYEDSSSNIKVTKTMIDEISELLTLLKIPYVISPSEGEAQ